MSAQAAVSPEELLVLLSLPDETDQEYSPGCWPKERPG
jgi:hypothetical protein